MAVGDLRVPQHLRPHHHPHDDSLGYSPEQQHQQQQHNVTKPTRDRCLAEHAASDARPDPGPLYCGRVCVRPLEHDRHVCAGRRPSGAEEHVGRAVHRDPVGVLHHPAQVGACVGGEGGWEKAEGRQ
eukprot:366503-Chlamydomonas_euryale.AAC.20